MWTYQFTDESFGVVGTIVAWDWDFGDGSPHGTDQNPTHSYLAPGWYTVTLTVTDDAALESTYSRRVNASDNHLRGCCCGG